MFCIRWVFASPPFGDREAFPSVASGRRERGLFVGDKITHIEVTYGKNCR